MTLSIESLTVRYGEKIAVDDVTLDIAVGDVLALVGPSGCGKSTLLRTIAGLVEPAQGRVVWQGRDITSVPTHQRGIGLMFQDHALFTHRSVADNIGFGLKMAGVDAGARDARVEELLVLVGVSIPLGYSSVGKRAAVSHGGQVWRSGVTCLVQRHAFYFIQDSLGLRGESSR